MAGRAKLRTRPAIPPVIWPGFVDALTGVLLVMVFTISTFILVQFFLRDELAGQDRAIALLESRIGELSNLLALEQGRSADLEAQLAGVFGTLTAAESELAAARREHGIEAARASALSAELLSARASAEAQAQQLATSEEATLALTLDLESARAEAERVLLLLAAADAAKEELADELERAAALQAAARDEQRALSEEMEREKVLRVAANRALAEARQSTIQDRQRITLLNRQIAAIRAQLLTLQSQLEASEERDRENQATIENLGSRLNVALSQRVSELARFRSEFFGRVREALGDREDVRIVGDRFVFQSGVLFPTASAEIGPDGRADLAGIADALRDIAKEIPTEIAWLIRVDGHTDRRPLRSGSRYADNWELSQARALAVVRFFVEEELLPPKRFAATGFGFHQPIDTGDSPEALARNRRIELTLTRR